MSFRRITHGIYGGLVGGVVFGMLMGMMGMLPMIAGMLGSSSAAVGFGVHLVMSAAIGVGYVLTFGRLVASTGTAVGTGLGYGAFWWLLGPLTLMPLVTGMGFWANWTTAAAVAALPSLMGHLIYGGLLGFVFGRLERTTIAGGRARVPQQA